MSETSAAPVRRPRLNPFAFPSDTTLRFVLLVIFVVCGSGKLYRSFNVDGRADHTVFECVSRNVPDLSRIDSLTLDDISRLWSSAVDCLATLRHGAWWSISGIILTIVTAAIFYWLYPVWKLRSGRLERLSSSDLPEVEHELLHICQAASLPNPPIFVWNPVAAGLPLAFGRSGRYYVALSGSFIARYFYSDRHAFRAILLHELAHIRNGDISKTYLVLALWLAFLTTTIAPFLFLTLWLITYFHSSDAIAIIVHGLIWTGVVVLSGLAVLRTREYYADVRASVWSKASHVDRVLAELPTIVGKGWRRYFRFHPGSSERRQIVEDPSRLFQLSCFDAFGIGIAAWSIVEVLRSSTFPFVPKSQWEAFVFVGLTWVILPAVVLVFAVSAIGMGVWRNAFASLLKGDQPHKRAGWLGVAFVAGSFPGSIVALVDSVLQEDATQSTFYSLIIALTADILTSIILLVLCFFLFRWIADASSAWFKIVLQSRSPRFILSVTVGIAFILIIIALALAILYVPLFVLIIPWRSSPVMWIYFFDLAVGGPLLLASVVIWAFPLAALWWQKKATPAGVAHWVFLDDSSFQLPEREPLRPRGALLTGIATALIFWLLWGSFRFRTYLPIGIADTIHSAFSSLFIRSVHTFGNSDRGIGFLLLLTNSATGFQALAAAIAAGRARRLSAVCGLFAASVSGGIIVFSIGPFFQWWTSELIWISLLIMGQGAVAALPTAIVAASIGGAIRWILPGTAEKAELGVPVTDAPSSLQMISCQGSNAAGFGEQPVPIVATGVDE